MHPGQADMLLGDALCLGRRAYSRVALPFRADGGAHNRVKSPESVANAVIRMMIRAFQSDVAGLPVLAQEHLGLY